jgi:uncharacterized repeat protein (TIGR03803 family)
MSSRSLNRLSRNQFSAWPLTPSDPAADLVTIRFGKFIPCKKLWATFLLFAAVATAAFAQTKFTTLLSFEGTNGANPHYVYLVQGTDGNLYGTAFVSTGSGGTVFKVTPKGVLTTIYTFCPHGESCSDGAQPEAGLVLATDGNFYGTASGGGANSVGTVFRITSAGKLTLLHSFDSTDGASPEVGLIQAGNGELFGTTSSGGSGDVGTIFDITTAGKLTSLVNFIGTNGDYPDGKLVQGSDGNFYGTTEEGTSDSGTVFKMTLAGKLTTLHKFTGTDGAGPTSALFQASNGNFYGTTQAGGAHGDGTVFEITPAGKHTTLYSFCAKSDCADGANPSAGLIQATDGDLYGTTFSGGSNETSCNAGCGTIFRITTAGKLTTLYNFCSKSGCVDGSQPQEGLVQHTNGTLYGLTYYGGTDGLGTVYSLSEGLGAFVETVPTSATVGTKVTILGTNLEGASSVTFDGTAATFKVISQSEITTTVPTGAKTGTVQVTTSAGTLSSNVPFVVKN